MKLRYLNKIEGFHDHNYFGIKEALNSGKLGCSSDTTSLKVVDSTSFEVLGETEYPSNLVFKIIEDKLWFVQNGTELIVYDLISKTKKLIYSGEQNENTNLFFINDNILLEDTRVYEDYIEKSKHSKLLKLDNFKEFFNWSDKFELIYLSGDNYIFFDSATKSLHNRTINNGDIAWETILNGQIQIKYAINISENLLVPIKLDDNSYDLINLNLSTGEILWCYKNSSLKFYVYQNQVLTLMDNSIIQVDLKNGNVNKQTPIDYLNENKAVLLSHLTDIEKNKLYYTTVFGADDSKNVILGMIQLDTFENKTTEIPIDYNKVDMRSPIGRPFVLENHVYIEEGKELKRYEIEE